MRFVLCEKQGPNMIQYLRVAFPPRDHRLSPIHSASTSRLPTRTDLFNSRCAVMPLKVPTRPSHPSFNRSLSFSLSFALFFTLSRLPSHPAPVPDAAPTFLSSSPLAAGAGGAFSFDPSADIDTDRVVYLDVIDDGAVVVVCCCDPRPPFDPSVGAGVDKGADADAGAGAGPGSGASSGASSGPGGGRLASPPTVRNTVLGETPSSPAPGVAVAFGDMETEVPGGVTSNKDDSAVFDCAGILDAIVSGEEQILDVGGVAGERGVSVD